MELPQKKQEFHAGALKYQSARAAFTALLQNMPEVSRIWVPAYICEAMLAPIEFTHKECAFYRIDEQFNIASSIKLKKNDLLLYVNYFGVCDAIVHRVLEKFNHQQVIIDCSQAFYAGPYDCLATIYSPRKFFGVPDGGLMMTKREIIPPLEQDSDSVLRMEHLITRLAFSAEAGYASYQRAEASLENCLPKAMSELTKKLLGSIDYSAVKKYRLKNFYLLDNLLKKNNQIELGMSLKAPLCYPFLPKNKIDKKRLSDMNIYIPTYWPGVEIRVGENNFENDLINKLIAIPCNQGMDPELDIDFIFQNIKGDIL